MRAVVQRVCQAEVEVDREIVGRIGGGLLVYLGVEPDDAEADAVLIADKLRHLRIFPDGQNQMNLDVSQAAGGILLVSAFTTTADARKGRRPSFDRAASGPVAQPWYERVRDLLIDHGIRVETGTFGAMMKVHSINDGPICILLDSRRAF